MHRACGRAAWVLAIALIWLQADSEGGTEAAADGREPAARPLLANLPIGRGACLPDSGSESNELAQSSQCEEGPASRQGAGEGDSGEDGSLFEAIAPPPHAGGSEIYKTEHSWRGGEVVLRANAGYPQSRTGVLTDDLLPLGKAMEMEDREMRRHRATGRGPAKKVANGHGSEMEQKEGPELQPGPYPAPNKVFSESDDGCSSEAVLDGVEVGAGAGGEEERAAWEEMLMRAERLREDGKEKDGLAMLRTVVEASDFPPFAALAWADVMRRWGRAAHADVGDVILQALRRLPTHVPLQVLCVRCIHNGKALLWLMCAWLCENLPVSLSLSFSPSLSLSLSFSLFLSHSLPSAPSLAYLPCHILTAHLHFSICWLQVARAQWLFDRGDWHASARAFRRALDHQLQHGRGGADTLARFNALVGLGGVLKAMRELDMATMEGGGGGGEEEVKIWREVVRLQPMIAGYWNDLANALWALAWDAVHEGEGRGGCDPEHAGKISDGANMLQVQGAGQAVAKALDLAPLSASSLTTAAAIYLDTQDAGIRAKLNMKTRLLAALDACQVLLCGSTVTARGRRNTRRFRTHVCIPQTLSLTHACMRVSRRVIEAPQEGRLCAEAPEEGKLCDILAYLGLIEFEDSADASLALPFLARALTIDPTHVLAEEAYREIVWQSVGDGAPVMCEPIPASVSAHTVPADLSPASSAAGEETCGPGAGVSERGAMQGQEEKGSSRSAEPAFSLDSSAVPACVGEGGRKMGGAGRGAGGLGAKEQTVLQDGYIHCGGRWY